MLGVCVRVRESASDRASRATSNCPKLCLVKSFFSLCSLHSLHSLRPLPLFLFLFKKRCIESSSGNASAGNIVVDVVVVGVVQPVAKSKSENKNMYLLFRPFKTANVGVDVINNF